MRLTVHVWRQSGPKARGSFERHELADISGHASFLEMLDVLNEAIVTAGGEPFAFEHDCREGICGSCGMVINGIAHGPQGAVTTCQVHMRTFQDGDEIWIEPWRADAFPVLKDLVVDRSAFDRIIGAGGFVSVNTGSAPDGNAMAVPKDNAELALDAEGRFLGLRTHTKVPIGAYFTNDRNIRSTTGGLGGLAGVYGMPAIHARVTGALTNMMTNAQYRGGAKPEPKSPSP